MVSLLTTVIVTSSPHATIIYLLISLQWIPFDVLSKFPSFKLYSMSVMLGVCISSW